MSHIEEITLNGGKSNMANSDESAEQHDQHMGDNEFGENDQFIRQDHDQPSQKGSPIKFT